MNAETPRRKERQGKNSFEFFLLLPWRLGVLAFAFSLIGCSANTYQKWADQQVDSIVRNRAEPTLGYTPQVDASGDVKTKPTTQAYVKVPTTPKPPPATSPIEPSRAHLP